MLESKAWKTCWAFRGQWLEEHSAGFLQTSYSFVLRWIFGRKRTCYESCHVTPTDPIILTGEDGHHWTSLKILDPTVTAWNSECTNHISKSPRNRNFPIWNTMILPFFRCGCNGFLFFGSRKRHILQVGDRLRSQGKAGYMNTSVEKRRGVEMWSKPTIQKVQLATTCKILHFVCRMMVWTMTFRIFQWT